MHGLHDIGHNSRKKPKPKGEKLKAQAKNSIRLGSRLGSSKVFISAKGLYLSIGSEIAGLIADSVSKGLFFSMVQFSFQDP